MVDFFQLLIFTFVVIVFSLTTLGGFWIYYKLTHKDELRDDCENAMALPIGILILILFLGIIFGLYYGVLVLLHNFGICLCN